MKTRQNTNLKSRKGLTLVQVAILVSLNMLYYYGVLSIIGVAIVIVLAVFARTIQLVVDISLTQALTMIIGVIVFYPSRWLQKYFLNNWKVARDK